jgi:hypothetical protein
MAVRGEEYCSTIPRLISLDAAADRFFGTVKCLFGGGSRWHGFQPVGLRRVGAE